MYVVLVFKLLYFFSGHVMEIIEDLSLPKVEPSRKYTWPKTNLGLQGTICKSPITLNRFVIIPFLFE